MTYIDTIFNTSGKIAADSNLFEGPIDQFVSQDGITKGFGKIIAEQVFKPLKSPSTPFYQRFAGRALPAGTAWTERALKTTNLRKFNPKASAEDALKFYDSEGIEKTYGINVNLWCPVSIPSDLVSPEMMLNGRTVGELNSMLVDNVMNAYQQGIESIIEKHAISMTKNSTQFAFTADTIVDDMEGIMDIATKMMGNDVNYNELTELENKDLITSSDGIYLFMDAKLLNMYSAQKAKLPSPDYLTQNVEIVPMFNALPTPPTTAEAAQWTEAPVAVDQPAPVAFMCAKDKIEYRPYAGSYKVNMQVNGSGDFTNEHLIARGAVVSRVWCNSIRINKTA